MLAGGRWIGLVPFLVLVPVVTDVIDNSEFSDMCFSWGTTASSQSGLAGFGIPLSCFQWRISFLESFTPFWFPSLVAVGSLLPLDCFALHLGDC